MCAIAGIISKKQGERLDPARIEEMIRAIKHRGPDETGYYRRTGVQLGDGAAEHPRPSNSGGLCPVVRRSARGGVGARSTTARSTTTSRSGRS